MRPHRRRSRRLAIAATLAVPLLAASGCADDADPADAALDPDSTEVEYRYTDSSVEPRYHRSYTITVADGEARMVVDVYGDELHDVTEAVDDATWADLIDRLDALHVGDAGGADGCSGGTARDLVVTDAEHPPDDPAVRAALDVCGGDGEAAADAVDDAIAPILGLFDTETLLATG
jgi:hypothetical protein